MDIIIIIIIIIKKMMDIIIMDIIVVKLVEIAEKEDSVWKVGKVKKEDLVQRKAGMINLIKKNLETINRTVKKVEAKWNL